MCVNALFWGVHLILERSGRQTFGHTPHDLTGRTTSAGSSRSKASIHHCVTVQRLKKVQYAIRRIETMFFLVFILSYLTAIKAGSHSLMIYATYITGQTPYPESSAVVLLDDVQLMYLDSITWKLAYRSSSISEYYKEEQVDLNYIFNGVLWKMKEQKTFFRNRFNYTDGVHVFQSIAGCELLDNDKPGILLLKDSVNGFINEEWIFNMAENSWVITTEWAPGITQTSLKLAAENVIRFICLKHLQKYLQIEKNNVLKKVKPRVRLVRKIPADSGGEKITCLATGFYPRHINLTLLRNGKPVDDHQITGGELLPNGDGTYQMKKSLEIPAEELRHNYRCSVTHLSLDNKLDVKIELGKNNQASSTVAVVCSVLVLICVTALIITAVIMWKKRHTVGRTSESSSQSDYTPAFTSEGEDK